MKLLTLFWKTCSRVLNESHCTLTFSERVNSTKVFDSTKRNEVKSPFSVCKLVSLQWTLQKVLFDWPAYPRNDLSFAFLSPFRHLSIDLLSNLWLNLSCVTCITDNQTSTTANTPTSTDFSFDSERLIKD